MANASENTGEENGTSWDGLAMTSKSDGVTVILHFTRVGRSLQLHRLDGPARILTTKEGRTTEQWFVNDISIPTRLVSYIQNTDKITLDFILSERNAQRRMLWLRLAGAERILGNEHLRIVSEDTDPLGLGRRLYTFRIKSMDHLRWSDPIRELSRQLREVAILEVHNSTPPHEAFALFVPSDLPTCEAAVAWTFPVDIPDFIYNPNQEA